MKIVEVGRLVLWPAKMRDGSKVVILNKNRILLLKRRNVPFITNPGTWSFVGGHRDENETYLETAYRETMEETGLRRSDLRLVNRPKKMELRDVNKDRYRWVNMIFIFASKTDRIKLDIENAKYRWATFDQLKREENFTNDFVDKEGILKMIKSALEN